MSAKVTDYFESQNFSSLYNKLEDGDLLEIKRGSFSHWAVFIGRRECDGKITARVIHRVLPENPDWWALCMRSFHETEMENLLINPLADVRRGGADEIGNVVVDNLESVVSRDRVRINNSSDKYWPPKCTAEIVARAEFRLRTHERNRNYNLMSNNCEHFANECRYGKHSCSQITGFFFLPRCIVNLFS